MVERRPAVGTMSLIACGRPKRKERFGIGRGGDRAVARVGLGEQRVAVAQADDRVVHRIDRVDARERRLHQLAARELARGEHRRESMRRQVGDLVRRHRAAHREPNIICRAIVDFTGPSACKAGDAEAARRAGAGQRPGEAAGEEIGGGDHRPAVGRALPFELAQHGVDVAARGQRAHQLEGVAHAEVEALAGDRMERLRRVADAHRAAVGEGALGAQAERELLQRRERGDARRARMEDRVEHGDALRRVEPAHRIVGAVDAPDERGRAVAPRQQRGRAVAREALVGDAVRAGRRTTARTSPCRPTRSACSRGAAARADRRRRGRSSRSARTRRPRRRRRGRSARRCRRRPRRRPARRRSSAPSRRVPNRLRRRLRLALLGLEPHLLQRRDDRAVAHHRAEHRHGLVDRRGS